MTRSSSAHLPLSLWRFTLPGVSRGAVSTGLESASGLIATRTVSSSSSGGGGGSTVLHDNSQTRRPSPPTLGCSFHQPRTLAHTGTCRAADSATLRGSGSISTTPRETAASGAGTASNAGGGWRAYGAAAAASALARRAHPDGGAAAAESAPDILIAFSRNPPPEDEAAAAATAAAAAAPTAATAMDSQHEDELYHLTPALAGATAAGPLLMPMTAGTATADHPPAGAAAAAAAAARSTSAAAARTDTLPAPPLSFTDHRAVFEGQSTWQLLRAYGVLRACGVNLLVDNAEALLAASRRLPLLPAAVDAAVKATFFAHFCAGEDVAEVRRTVERLRASGVGAILDYAAEDDVGSNTAGGATDTTTATAAPAAASPAAAAVVADTAVAAPTAGAAAAPGSIDAAAAAAAATAATAAAADAAPAATAAVALSPRALGVVGRTYDYESEEQCDRHVQHFLSAIEMAAQQPGRPAFAAIKITALGNPALLQRASAAVAMMHRLFARFDEDGSGFVDRHEFERQWRRLVAGAPATANSSSPELEAVIRRQGEETYRWLDKQGTGKVDYVSWCSRLDLRHLPLLAARIAEGGAGAVAGGGGGGSTSSAEAGSSGSSSRAVADMCLDEHEVELMAALLGRLQTLVAAALRADVRLMIDAEHSYFQPAIEHLTLRLMQQHNRGPGGPRLLNTYQAYLTDCPARLARDLERARREGWVLGAKLVRGAYLHLERRRAEQLGYPSPCWPDLAATHACYDACAEQLIAAAAEGRAEVLLGTHNQTSVEAAVAAMARHGLVPPPQGSSASASGTSSAGRDEASAAAKRPPPPPASDRVMFGQLLGMSDHLTLTLGKAGYRAYKYVPYGQVGQVMPYLLRRAAENRDIMKGAKQDLVMLKSELRRRIAAAVGLAQ